MNRREAELRIKSVLTKWSDDTHNVFTPFELCDEMLDKLPELNRNQKIMVMFNLEFLYVLKERINNLENVSFLTPCKVKGRIAEAMGVKKNNIHFYSYNKKEIKNIENMPKFDVVVGNPPYQENLHLIMLKNAVEFLQNDGIIIWLHPARWVQDLLAPLKRGSDYIKYKNLPFVKFEIINSFNASKIFNLLFQYDLSISLLKKSQESILNDNYLFNLKSVPISFKRFIYNINFSTMDKFIEKNKRDGVRVKIRDIIVTTYGGLREAIDKYAYYTKDEIIIDGMINGKDWTENSQKNQFSKPLGSPLPKSIKFNSIEEANNFIQFTKTKFFKFFIFLTKVDVHVNHKYLPFMKDFTQEWTDEKLYKYFNLTQEEINYIESQIN